MKLNFWHNPGMLTACRMSIAAVLAFLVYKSLDLPQGYWAVVSIAAVTQAGLSGTITKSVMRIIGTLIGAAFGYGLTFLIGQNPLFIIIIFWIFITCSSYIAIQLSAFSYAGVVTGLTMVIVLASSMIEGMAFQLAVYRSIEVILGIVAIAVVTIVFDVIRCWIVPETCRSSVKNDMFHIFLDFKLRFNWSKLLAAVKISLAASITLITWLYLKYPFGFWATVTCLLIMEESTHATQIKGITRFWTHVAAALIGAICALLIHVHLYLLAIPLALGFFICGYFIGSGKPYRSLGNTLGIALAIMLLAGAGMDDTLSVVVARFLNVMYGIIIGLLITYFLFPTKSAEA